MRNNRNTKPEILNLMKPKYKYIIILALSFILYGNTLFHDYALDDALVISENHYTLSGFEGIKNIFTEEFFSGFFGQKDKKLVAGGRYRPLSMVTFAIEWQLIMGSPFDGLNERIIKNKLDENKNTQFIEPSVRLLKSLSNTIHKEDRKTRLQQQNSIIEKVKVFNNNEKRVILSNLKKMYARRGLLLFVSHLINILLYALTCIMLLILLEKLFSKYSSKTWYYSLPFLATLIYLVHPIHTEVIANIKGRDEILSLLGALVSMYFTFKYLDRQKVSYLILSFVSFLFGIFSKEVAVTFVAIIPLSIYFFDKKEKNTGIIFISILPLLIASGIYFYARNKVLGGISFEPGNELMNNSFLGMSVSEKYATIFYTLLIYIKLLIFPHPLTYDYYPYHISIMNWGDLWPVLSVIIYISIGIYALIGLKRKQIISYGILFYLITLSPMSNILFPIGVFMNERFVYAASIGFVIILAYILTNKMPEWVKAKNTFILVITVLLGLYSIKTISRNRAWKNDFTLFTTDVKTSVNSAKSNTSAGGKLVEEALKPGRSENKDQYLRQAVTYLKHAIKIHPTYSDALLLMGNAQWELYQDIDSVFKYYEPILKHNPQYARVYSNIFETKVNLTFNDAQLAQKNIEILHKLEKYNPNHFQINYNIGRIYGRFMNKLDKSKHYLEKAAQINTNDINVFKDLGVAYGISQEYEKSAGALSRAIQLDPKDPVLRINLAMTYANLQKFEDALKTMDTTINMKFEKKDAYTLVNLGNLYRNMGKGHKAQQCFDKAKELNPELFKK